MAKKKEKVEVTETTTTTTTKTTEKVNTEKTGISKKKKILIAVLGGLIAVCLAVGIILPIALLSDKNGNNDNDKGGYGQVDDDDEWTSNY